VDKNTRTARGHSARFSLVGGARGFLAAVGLVGALAHPTAAQPAPTRAAGLLPPQPLDPGVTPPLARGALHDVPSGVTSPVVRSGPRPTAPAGAGPTWLNGVDPNVRPASGTGPQVPAPVVNKPVPTPVTPRPTPAVVREESPRPVKPVEKTRAPAAPERLAQTDPNGGPETPNANTPFRGTTANGAPIYAGPPAYRWYGYGTVTPGANPFAPSGQYPKASANWYSVTGATPGAFPVPVMNPPRSPAGAEPPSYAALPTTRSPGPSVVNPSMPVVTTPPIVTPQPANPAPPAPAVAHAAGPGLKLEPTPPTATEPPKAGSPTGPAVPPLNFLPTSPTAPISAPASAESPAVPPPMPVGTPTISQPPGLGPIAPVMPPPVTPTSPTDPVGAAPTGLVPSINPMSAEPLAPPTPAMVPVPGTPVGPLLPRPATPGDVRWQPTGETPPPPEGTWTPAIPAGNSRLNGAPARPEGGTSPVARGQIGDAAAQPDPVGDLIRGVCKGRASGVEVRWTGSRRLTVCFEAATQAEATRLVNDLSARPELNPLQIDFCVLVK
jgi:hypothetical protein